MGLILGYWGRVEGKDMQMNHEVAMMPVPKCVNWASQRLGDKAEVIQMTENPSSAGPKVLALFLVTSSSLKPD